MNWFAALPGPLRGVLWMTCQAASFSAMVAAIRHLAPTYGAMEIVFLRAAVGLVLQAPWALRGGWRTLAARRWKLVLLRSLLLFGGSFSWFVALGRMPISDATALQFTLPLFAVLGAWLILGERVGLRRWVATLAGFAGVLIILRPGFLNISAAALIVLGAAALYAGVHLTTKKISGEMSGSALILHGNLVMLVLSLGPALPTWVTPTLADAPWIVAIGLFGMIAHLFMTRAYRAADASIVAPVDCLKLPFAAILGWLLFRELSDVWTWAGAAIIFAATTYITRFEARHAVR